MHDQYGAIRSPQGVGVASLVEKVGWRPATHLIATQLEGNSDINGLIDNTHHRAYQGHEEQWEPDDGNDEEDDEATHTILDNFLLLLSLGLWVFLEGRYWSPSQALGCRL